MGRNPIGIRDLMSDFHSIMKNGIIFGNLTEGKRVNFDCKIKESEKEMGTYTVERSNVYYNKVRKSMICTFTITLNETREKHVFNNIFLAEDNKEAFLVFPSTCEKVYINRDGTELISTVATAKNTG